MSEAAPKAEFRPNPDPQWVKETMVEDYKRIADRNGAAPSVGEIERIVLEDLRVSDAVDRDSKAPQAKKSAAVRAEPSERVTKLAAELGMTLFRRAPGQAFYQPRSTHADFLGRPPKNEKQAAAIKRIAEITTHRSKVRLSKQTDFEVDVLARAFIEVRESLAANREPFRSARQIDKERIFWNCIYTICDRSDSKFPRGWWIPK